MNKSGLRKILETMRVSLTEEIEKELMEQYGNYHIEEEGHEFHYTDQDVYEQLRKKLRDCEEKSVNY